MMTDPHAMTTAQLREAINREETAQTLSAEEAALMRACADFKDLCPDFNPSPENINALLQHATIWTPDRSSIGAIPTTDQLVEAHALANYRRAYISSERTPDPTANPHDCSLSELGKAVRGEEPVAADEAWTAPIRELHAQLTGEPPDQPDPAHAMSTAELRQSLEVNDAT